MYDWRPGGFGLYVHWPYCQSKCPYCDFNSHVADRVNLPEWRECFVEALSTYASETRGRTLETIYFGGGTPSLMPPDLVSDVIASIRSLWPMVNDPEITLEANPGSVEAGRFREFRQAGVNRISLGVQALDDSALKLLGRRHTKQEALRALEIANTTFSRVSFDLIYARQFQTFDQWRTELCEALQIAGEHLSLYQLTVEDGTMFGKRAKLGKLPGLPDEELGADMFELTQDLTGAAGLRAYEVSNHAREGTESRHNMIYWRGGDYIGIGPGAHGRITTSAGRQATETPRSPALWLQQVRKSGTGESSRNTLAREDMALEYLLMSLRTTEGMDIARYVAITNQPLPESRVRDLTELGLVEMNRGFLRTTQKGRPVLNAILRDLCT